jgi:hypothetical protein
MAVRLMVAVSPAVLQASALHFWMLKRTKEYQDTDVSIYQACIPKSQWQVYVTYHILPAGHHACAARLCCSLA